MWVAEKNMWLAFANAKVNQMIFSKNISVFAIFNDQNVNDMLTNDIVSFEKLSLGPIWSKLNELLANMTLKFLPWNMAITLLFLLKICE